MRNLHVIASVNPATGGPIEGLKQIASVLTGRGHMIEVACLDDPDSPWLSEFPLPVHALGPGKGAFGFAPKMVPWLQANAQRFDAVVVNGIWQYNSYAVWKVFRNAKIPYFVFTHGMLDPWFNQAYPLKRLKKMLYWPWGLYPVLRDARYVLFTSEEEKRLARGSFRPYKVNERVVKYGTPGPKGDLAALRERFLDKNEVLQGKRVLTYLSRIHEKKGCDLLVQAFAKVCGATPDVLLVMAGPDKTNLVPTLQTMARDAGIADRILWPGMLAGDDKWGAFCAAEAFVLPSHQENFGIVVAEALACGTPVLISDKINIWREIQSAGAGIVNPDTLAGTEATLQEWMGLDEAGRKAMSENARQCFLDNFEITAAAECLLEVTRDGRDIP
ncbi:MAG: glycosyltransferase [Armatimonadetes bacterium]|nr:glycosyltransferase [Armatimonadota bacterium]